mgnify:CR=1 FL=1|jgi:hypothetical protein
MASYPSDKQSRLEYWRRQIEYAEEQMRPLWDASDILQKQYLNEATTEREKMQEQGDREDHVSRIKANLIFGWVDQSIANLLERNPAFLVTPRTRDSVAGSRTVKHIVDYWYRETSQLQQDERILLDAFLGPYGVKKIGWTIDYEQQIHDMVEQAEFQAETPEDEITMLSGGIDTRIVREQNHEQFIEHHTRWLQDPMLSEDLPEAGEEAIKLNIKIRKKMLEQGDDPDVNTSMSWEAPFGMRWRPKDFLVDPLAQDGIRDARWIAFRFRRPVEDFQSNPIYENTDDIEPSDRLEGAPDMSQGALADDDFGLAVGWEIWARNFPVGNRRRSNLLMTLVEGHDEFLQHDEEWPIPTLDDYPVEVLSLNSTSETWYAKPALLLAGADNIQSIAHEILDSYLSIIRKQKNALLYDREVITDDIIEELLAAPDMTAIPAPGLSGKPGAVQPLQFGSVQGDKGEMLGVIRGLFDQAAGTPQPMSMPGEQTATESSIHERRTTAREQRRGNLLSQLQVNTARKFWQMTVFFRPERAVLIDPQANMWMNVDEGTARGEYRFAMDVASQANAIALERKNWMDLLNLFSGLTGLWKEVYGKPPNLADLANKLLSRGYNIPNPEDIIPGGTESPEDEDIINQMLTAENREAAGAGGAGGPDVVGGADLFQQGGGRAAPSMDGPPRQVEEAVDGQAAIPRAFNQPAASEAQQSANAETP